MTKAGATIHFQASVQMHRVGFTLALDAGEAGVAKWQKVFPLGETRHRGDFGAITFDRAFLESMVRNYQAEGKPERPWDFFHRGSSNDTEVRNEDKVASGWFSDVELRGDGLYVLTTWTDEAREMISAKKVRYPSPTFSENATDPKTGLACGPKLLSVALLNDPFLTDLPPVKASANPPHPKGTTMFKLAAIVSALKLDEKTTEENLETALKAKLDELDAAKAEVVQLKAQVDAESKKGGATGELITKLSQRIDAQDAELKKMRDASATAAVVALQVKLETEGRIRADQKPMVAELVTAIGLDKATAMSASWPVVVDLKERGTNKPGPEGGMTPEEAHKQLELKAAELVKAGAAEQSMAYREAARLNPELAAKAVQLSTVRETARQMKA